MPRRRGRGRGGGHGGRRGTSTVNRTSAVTNANIDSKEWFAEAFGAQVPAEQPQNGQNSLNDVTPNNNTGEGASSSVFEAVSDLDSTRGVRTSESEAVLTAGAHGGRSVESSDSSKSVAVRAQSPGNDSHSEEEEEEDDDEDAVDDHVDLDPELERAYFERRVFETELSQPPLKEWTFEQVAAFVRRLAHFEPKYDACWEKIAQLVELKSMNGALMCAVDRKYLHEEMVASGSLRKRDRDSRMVRATQILFEKLEAEKETQAFTHYWAKLLDTDDPDSAAVAREYANSSLLPHLVELLHPLPRKSVKFVHVDFTQSLSVKVIDEFVAKKVLPSDEAVVAKVVSASTVDEPEIVKMNLLYFKHPTRRRWQLLTSVDFAQHGAADPGHWHLNRSSDGGFIAHSGMGDTAGSWHGDPECAPLWWSFIPAGTSHFTLPHRISELKNRLVDEEE